MSPTPVPDPAARWTTGGDIIDSVDVPILAVDGGCAVSKFNPAAAALFSLTPADAGRPLREIPLLANVRRLEELCREATGGGVSSQCELRDASTGSWYVLRIVPHELIEPGTELGSEPRARGAVITLQNVTAFRASLEQAIYEREYTKAIVNSVIDPLVVLDEDCQVQAANQAFYARFQVSREQAHGSKLYEIGSRDWEIPRLRVFLSETHANNQSDALEFEHVFPEIGRRTVLLNARRLSQRGALGQLILVTIQDITDRKRREEELQRSNADLQQFAYSASHDLQEPLRMVTMFSELLKRDFDGKLGAKGDEYIGHTIQGALRMAQLLKDLQAYTLASAVQDEPKVDVDADAVLERSLANLAAGIKESGAAITRTELPSLRMHDFQLEQLFQNLIGNAIRYRSDKPLAIHIAAAMRGPEWLLSVEDNGIGIDPEYQEKVFGIFQRLHSSAEYPGTGMGLAICQRIVERAGGRIWIESALRQGSTFFFTVPRIAN